MWALIAFIILGIVVASLIEINERIKAKRKGEQLQTIDNCTKHETGAEACADCGLIDICEKKEKTTA